MSIARVNWDLRADPTAPATLVSGIALGATDNPESGGHHLLAIIQGTDIRTDQPVQHLLIFPRGSVDLLRQVFGPELDRISAQEGGGL